MDDVDGTLDVSAKCEEGDDGQAIEAAQNVQGVDYSIRWTPGLVSKLKEGGYVFAVRYIGTPGRSKSLVAPEVAALRTAGISIVSVYEDREGTALLGYDRGAKDALAAVKDSEKLGMPKTRPVYMAVDTDTTPAKVAQYFKGAIAAIGKERVGVYGGYWIIKGLYEQGLSSWFWQTRAWSKVNGKFIWHDACHLRQFPLASPFYVLGSCDLDWAMKLDYGQWDIDTPPVPPGPKPEPSKDRTLYLKYPHMTGPDVRTVQMQLKAILIAPRLIVDSIYGPATVSAVKSFQDHEDLVADGVCGPATWKALRRS
jgi:hypothetical protein